MLWDEKADTNSVLGGPLRPALCRWWPGFWPTAACPGQMAVQWSGETGEVISLMSKPWAVIAIPAVLMVMHWVVYATVHSMVLGPRLMGALREGLGWLIPLLSVAMYSVIFAANLTGRIQILVLLFSLVGLAVLSWRPMWPSCPSVPAGACRIAFPWPVKRTGPISTWLPAGSGACAARR